MRPKFLKSIDERVQKDIMSSVEDRIQDIVEEVASPHNDGYTQLGFKKELWDLKCLIEDIYEQMPSFGNNELEWEKERVYNKLKGKL
jgi:hypothetical protein